ncbi:hypothetical protein OGAPHI_007337 [Ogataea philodendri]|uniref:U3 small nucleolar RNA-associated protein 20 n=1 Tax=Ogataea philodendri TaxID=1378263 RepID=A0A9P8NVR1_9ASCO|nr:uncharacterized protein OGAPHI_007337 [Ogataea philodendri]KAH3660132.1 hypothetical protein OGAPHI_007337 [Ogataea philodendri]
MVKKRGTESGRRFVYTSFKDRIDAIQIDPVHKLDKKAFHEAEVSHFLSTLDHWREINLSKSFTELVEVLDPLCLSLPQLLYHQSQIFQHVNDALTLGDKLSLQPVLELLTQFCHDLGSDFLPYYSKTLETLVQVATTQSDADSLEWMFNALAYLFKYLSKELSKDLVPTFKLLEPLMNSSKKTYLARFASQAMSFLVRKASSKSLLAFVEVAMNQDLDVDTYFKSVVVIFAEAMKNAGESLHSKSPIMLDVLTHVCQQSESKTAVLSDILMEVLEHVSDGELVYSSVLEKLDFQSAGSVWVLTTLAFAESGKKVPNWSVIFDGVSQLPQDSDLVLLYATLMRNSDQQELSKRHVALFTTMMSKQNQFLPFIDAALEIAPERTLGYGKKYITSFITKNWEQKHKEIAYFLDRMNSKNVQLDVVILREFNEYIQSSVDEGLYWRLLLLQYTKATIDQEQLISKLPQLSASEQGLILKVVSKVELSSDDYQTIIDQIATSATNLTFLEGVYEIVMKNPLPFRNDQEQLLDLLSANLVLPSHSVREITLNIMMLLFEEPPEPLGVCRLIEQIPLDLQTGREIQLRYRALVQTFMDSPKNDLMDSIVAKFSVGQMSNKFSPSWNGVLEFLEGVFKRIEKPLWEQIEPFLTREYESKTLDSDEEMLDTVWNGLNPKLVGYVEKVGAVTQKYESVDKNFSSNEESVEFTEFYREQCLRILQRLPKLAETHFNVLLPFVVEDDEDTVKWSVKDRNSVVEIMAKFQNLRRVPGADTVHTFLLRLLANRSVQTQKLAFGALSNWKNPAYNRYRDNLNGLLDDMLFRDEVINLLQNNEKNIIQPADEEIVMPLILRILFGRAQTLKTSGTKQGRKMAAVKAISNLSEKHLQDFLALSFEKLNEMRDQNVNFRLIRTASGFLNMVSDLLPSIGRTRGECLAILLDPLIYSLSVSEKAIGSDDEILDKAARNNRQLGFRVLFEVADYLGETFDWQPYGDVIYTNLVQHKMANFAEENLQQPSSLMRLMTSLWPAPNMQFFLNYDEFAPVKALMGVLKHEKAKESVQVVILQFVNKLLNSTSSDEKHIDMMLLIISEYLNALVQLFELSDSREVNSLCVKILHTLVERDLITGSDSSKYLVDSLVLVLDKPASQIDMSTRTDIVSVLAMVTNHIDCTLMEIMPLYKSMAPLLKVYDEREMRVAICKVYLTLGKKYAEFERVSEIIDALNAYSPKRIREPDYERRLETYRNIDKVLYDSLSGSEWLPVIYTALYHVNDEADQAMRSSAGNTLIRFVDVSENFQDILHEIVLPVIRPGLRRKNELVRLEYINVVARVVEIGSDLADMKVLLHGGDEEANFFKNVMHPQVHRRQRAIRRLGDLASEFTEQSISHYLLPMIEKFVYWEDDKYRNLANDTVATVSKLAAFVSWNQYRAILSRYVSTMATALQKEKHDELRDSILLVTSVASALKDLQKRQPRDLPSGEKLDGIIVDTLIPQIKKVLTKRDEQTVVHRVVLSEALASLIICCSEEKMQSELPGILTSICQILRARSEELRDAVRKHLGRIAVALGSSYLKFIMQELKTALNRGPQIHILSYTFHYLLIVLDNVLTQGDLDECTGYVIEAVMNDIFGTASEEKEAEGYNKKMKEIKHNKSYDTAELLASKMLLQNFSQILNPIRLLLREKLAFKVQKRLDELLRRVSIGLQKNAEASSTNSILLCHEIYNQSLVQEEEKVRRETESEDHFLVKLDSKPQKTQMEYTLYSKVLQKFAFDLLLAVVSKNQQLFTPGNLEEFVPLLETGLSSGDEGVVISSLKMLTLLSRLEFSETVNGQFTACARATLKIIKDIPSTNNELCQNSLKFLSSVIRNRDGLLLKDTAVSYILKKIEPDLDEPMRQGVAFGFVKALIAKHVMLPEIYDVLETVSRIMVTSTSAEIRQTARSVFYTFLMEYDQSRGRLEKQFKMLLGNLEYPAQSGRQSVMELIHLIVKKAGKELLSLVASSFFIALANVSVTDESPSCREMASEVLSQILGRVDDLAFIDKCTASWIGNTRNELLVRCGLHVYQLYVEAVGTENVVLNEVALEKINSLLAASTKSSEPTVSWELVYSSIIAFEKLAEKTDVYKEKYTNTWSSIIECLLYPHSWIRLATSRLVGRYVQEYANVEDKTLQTIAYRCFRQLSAPSISQTLANEVAKTLVYISKIWAQNNTLFVPVDTDEDKKQSVLDWALLRVCGVLKNESAPPKDLITTKKAMISYCVFLTGFLDAETLQHAIMPCLDPLIILSEQEPAIEDTGENTVPVMASKCLELVSDKIGVSEYNLAYAATKKAIMERRHERKTKRAQLSLNNPAAAAKRKLKKHSREREKRKHLKDENGLYRAKRRKEH